MLRSIGSVTVLALLMVGCGGGGGGSASSPPPPPANYTVGGTVTGLTGSGLVLMFSDSALSGPHSISLAVSASGGFTFSPAVPQGSGYTVYVGTQPSSPTQNCVVTNDTGFVGTANVTTVAVACSTVAGYTVGGTVSGLVGSGLALAICRYHGVPWQRGGFTFAGVRCKSVPTALLPWAWLSRLLRRSRRSHPAAFLADAAMRDRQRSNQYSKRQ